MNTVYCVFLRAEGRGQGRRGRGGRGSDREQVMDLCSRGGRGRGGRRAGDQEWATQP